MCIFLIRNTQWIQRKLFKKKFLENICSFLGATDIPVLDFWWHLVGFQSQGGFPHMHALSPECNRLLRFISGVTSADLLAATMVAKTFHPHTCVQALVGLESRIKHATAWQHVKRHVLPIELSQLGWIQKKLSKVRVLFMALCYNHLRLTKVQIQRLIGLYVLSLCYR